MTQQLLDAVFRKSSRLSRYADAISMRHDAENQDVLVLHCLCISTPSAVDRTFRHPPDMQMIAWTLGHQHCSLYHLHGAHLDTYLGSPIAGAQAWHQSLKMHADASQFLWQGPAQLLSGMSRKH